MRRKVGVFNNSDDAISAIRELQALGFTNEEISVVSRDESMKDFITEGQLLDETGSAAATGAVTGGIVGGLGALLIELGLIAIPGIGPFLAVGPVGAALVGALTGGAVGGLVGALVEMGFDEDEARVYDEQIQQGKILVMVDDHIDRTVDIDRILHPGPMSDRLDERDYLREDPRLDENRYPQETDSYMVDQWDRLREGTRQRWDRLTDEDFDTIRGDRELLRSRLQHHYGWDDEMADREIHEYYEDQIQQARYNDARWSDLDDDGDDLGDDIREGREDFKHTIRQKWDRLTDDEIESVRGDRQALGTKLEEAYGWDKPTVDREIDQHYQAYRSARPYGDKMDNPLAGKWDQIKGQIQRQWGKLTDDDLNVIQGDRNILRGKLKDYYGLSDEEADRQVSDYLRRF